MLLKIKINFEQLF